MNQILKKDIEDIGKIISLILIVAYGLGFIVWNTHLAVYGYFEYDLLQTRFLSTGILFLLISVFPLSLTLKLYPWFKRNSGIFVRVISISAIIIIYFLIFVKIIFPQIPQSLGGARPFAKWIIAEPTEIQFLSNFNIYAEKNGEKEPIETVPVCEIYSNRDTMIIGSIGEDGKQNRVLALKKDNWRGFQAMDPIQEPKAAQLVCKPFFYIQM